MSDHYMLEMVEIEKSFPGVKALDKVSFTLKPGEVHALVGENGAGKSTLMKIIGGIYSLDAGKCILDGNEVNIHDPRESIRLGISIVYQELNLVPAMTAGENIFLGAEIEKRKGFTDSEKMHSESQVLLDRLSVNRISAKSLLKDLTIAQQQMVEIAKAIRLNAKILVFDEPTSILGKEESALLFDVIRELKKEGISIIYISHRLDEIFEICDKATVLRDGQFIETLNLNSNNYSKADIIQLMVGRELADNFFNTQQRNISNEVILQVDNLSRAGEFKEISFSLKKGEILGFSGLVGAGRSELIKAIFGLTHFDKGSIIFKDKVLSKRSIRDSIAMGMTLAPEDRKKEGLVLGQTAAENVTLPTLKRKYSKFGFVIESMRKKTIDKHFKKLNIKPYLPNRMTLNFSGGNQQKIVLAKCLDVDPELLILDEPTRGIDVGAKHEIYTIIHELASTGVSVIVVSSEMEELLGICDRICVMHEGRITADFTSEQGNQEDILKAASGQKF